MADFRLGRLKFNWRGPWQASTAYVIDDIVSFGGMTYVCVVNHTSTSSQTSWYSTDYDIATPKWELYTPGFDYLGAWQTSTFYSINDIVTFGATVYICTADHTSSANQTSFESVDINYWDVFTSGITNRGNWTTSTFYKLDDIMKYGANTYRCINEHTSSNNQNLFYTNDVSNWILFVEGVTFRNDWTGTTWYRLNDVIRYGNNLYICTTGHTSTGTFDPTKFADYLQAIQFEDVWNSSDEYQIGDIVTYGGYAYVAETINTNKQPNLFVGTDWEVITTGFKAQGTWSAGTYKQGDVVIYGGDTYVAEATTTQNPSNTSVWSRITEGMYFANNWSSSTTYQRHDVVRKGSTSYISMMYDNANNDPATANATTWQVLAAGDTGAILTANGDTLYYSPSGPQRLPIGSNNNVLIANTSGLPQWKSQTANSVYYVSKNGSDTNDGLSLHSAFATIRNALITAPNNSTIYVKGGEYGEILPLRLKGGQQVVGDGIRTTTVMPANSTYETGTMFVVGDATMIKNIAMRGMTGFVANTGATPEDITTAANNTAGVFVAFDPTAPILTKSPYISDCSAFSNNGIGVVVDGSVHATGNKTMVFHAFTQIHDNGVGFWIKDRGGAEIVSCFTYYAHIGYTATGGGKIRALNGNNSYGNYGAVSLGFDTTETPNTGALFGEQMTLKPTFTGAWTIGATVTGVTSGATATITNPQLSVNKVYVKKLNGTPFVQDEALTVSDGSTGSLVNNSDFYTGQKGFILVMDGLSAIPRVGGSISIAGDPYSYVIQAVSGTYTNSSSVITVVLAGEKPSTSADGAAVTIRYKYSQVRLTGHDFLSIGTGGRTTTNYPGEPTQPSAQGNEIIETFPGRVFYVSTDQDGNFRVGEYFRIDQATGRATLNASAFDLSGLSSLRLGSIGAQLGEQINEFSSDVTMGGNSNLAVPTEFAVKSYVDGKISSNTTLAANSTTIAPSQSAVRSFVGLQRQGDVNLTFTANTINAAVGTVGAPSHTFTGDTDTGMWSPSNNNIAFSTNGAEVGRFTSAGFLEGVFSDDVVALGNSGTATTIDLRQGGVFTATLTGNCTFTLTNPNTNSNRGSSFTLILTNDGTGGRSVAWAGGAFRFPSGAALLNRTTTAGAVEVWAFFTPDQGTTWYGNIVMRDVKA